MCDMDKDVKWSWPKFFIGKLGNKFFAWVMSTVLVYNLLMSDHAVTSAENEKIVLIIWGVVTVIFMLAGALDVAVSNMKMTAELKAGASIGK